AQYRVFVEAVEAVRTGSSKVPHSGPVPELAPGPVRQPNHVRCVRTARWKLARTWDPSGQHPDEWELYDLPAPPTAPPHPYALHADATELHTLLVFDGPFPPVIRDLPAGLDRAEVEAAARATHALLERYERDKLAPWPGGK